LASVFNRVLQDKSTNDAGGTVAPVMVFAYIAAMDAEKLDNWE
jgi:hypothetical protein